MKRHLKKDDFKTLLRSRYWLRGHFLVMLIFTSLVTLGASHVLLSLGLHNILVRYLICLLFSYISFLILLRIWLGLYIFPSRENMTSDLYLDGADVNLASGNWRVGDLSPDLKGQGGGFSGAGASGDWGSKVEILGDLDGDSTPIVLPLIVILALATLALFLISAVGIAIYTAPALLCEIAVEMAVAIGVVRLTLKEEDLTKGSWLRTALRKTSLPFLALVLAVMAGLGVLVHFHPEVTKLSEIWQLMLNA